MNATTRFVTRSFTSRLNLPRATLLVATVLGLVWSAHALSLQLREPRLYLPKGYDEARAKAIGQVLEDKRFKFVDGIQSYWPPEWPTTLVYEGDAKSLHAFLDAVRSLKGVGVRVTFSPDLSKETGSALSAGSWWVKYSHTASDTLTVRVNLAAYKSKASEFEIWLSQPDKKQGGK